MKKVYKSSSAIAKAEGSTNVDTHSVCQPCAKPDVRRSYKILNYKDWYNSYYNSAPNLELNSNRSIKVYNTWASRVRKGIVIVP